MTTTPKWYCRNKSQPVHAFEEIKNLGVELRKLSKRIIVDVKMDVFTESDTIFEDCEKLIAKYWELKDETKNKDYIAITKKYKRSPYNNLLLKKYTILMELNDRRFFQFMFVLKKTICQLLRKSMHSEIWLNWALHLTEIYNKCRKPSKPDDNDLNEDEQTDSQWNANICSNMYPALLLPHKPIDFYYILQLVSQTHVEQNALDLMYGLFNITDDNSWHNENTESNCSSLEILRILTLNMTGDGDYQQYYDSTTPITPPSQRRDLNLMARQEHEVNRINCDRGSNEVQSSRSKHIECFLQKERIFIAQLITKANAICPTVFGCFEENKQVDLQNFAVRSMRMIWSYVGIILDHIMLWWIDTPISCYSLAHVDSIRSWLTLENVTDIPEPVYSTLRGVGEILTNFVCINIWDQLFRLTLISGVCERNTIEKSLQNYRSSPKNHFGTATGTVWVAVFANLTSLSNSFFPHAEAETTSLMPVAEQIPILHRIDHSVHSMRLWVTEQAKLLCCEWKMDRFFEILEHDVQSCLKTFTTFKLPKLQNPSINDVLMMVCVALRAKLVTEVNANVDKLKKTTEECVHILSTVCRVLSLANFTLCFPGPSHWQQTIYENDEKSPYVAYVLDEIFLPIIKATRDIVILKLILKLVCEAWLDYIYQKRVRFSVNGAIRLLNDFDEVREWILNCPLLDEEQLNKLTNHDVLRMCKGVGKILLRKPEDIISITQSPKYDRKGGDSSASANETKLPSEMFVSNQKHWLQLRANKNSFPFWKLCCGDNVL